MQSSEAKYLSAVERALLPNDADRAFFHEHGWWVSPPCLDDDLLEEAAWGVERYYAGERDWPLPLNPGTDWRPADGKRVRYNDYLSLQVREIRALIRHPVVPAMAARLAGTSGVRLFHDQLLYKPARDEHSDTAIGWHTDKSYWASCTSTNMLTAWIPLQTCTAQMGELAVYDGSHRWPHRDDLSNFSRQDLPTIEMRLAELGASGEPVELLLSRGQVSFHHCRTVHGSRPNRSDQIRIACAVHYQDTDNAYCRTPMQDGRMPRHINDLLCRRDRDGFPDYSDPAVFPRLWPPEEGWATASDRRRLDGEE